MRAAAPLALVTLSATALAAPPLVALAPADDARLAVALGPTGEAYEPDGKGAWVRTARITTADSIASAGRIGDAVVALGSGVLYRLATNGWSAFRLVQRGRTVLGTGPRPVAAVGRQLFALDRSNNGEPLKLLTADSPILAVAAGKSMLVRTERGVFKLEGGRLVAVREPERIDKVIGDRWAIADRGAVDVRSDKLVAWPTGFAVQVATQSPDERLIAAGARGGRIEVVTVRGAKLEQAALDGEPGTAVGIVADKSDRIAIAFSDGRIMLRDGGAWTTTTVREQLPADKPGPAPATSP
jgi:hypothetical protein